GNTLSKPYLWSLGEEEKNRCTPTKDSECQCKPGTFRGEDAPEFCQKCSTGCPDGKVMVMDCTPWSNIKCADQESSTLAHGEAPVPGELTTMSQRLPITPSPSSGSSRLVIKIASVITTVLIGCVWCYFTGLFNECWHKVIGFSSIWQHQALEKEAAENNTQSRDAASRLPVGLKLFFSDFAAIFSL
ncbi:PREDICTED: tumor necrosis factor receptor superfamily member 10B-like, partial [Bison bison bison]|uniref:Tumor necrosis factor receptor superfamily member 10B-like n=1 Tax=Bison bison bison TaxID=43346 RepID=A0A6P3GZ58_BISBB